MRQQKKISLILPAYNEAGRIAVTLSEAVRYFDSRGYTYEIIVAADGNDGTREIVAGMAKENPALRVIGGPERRGKGRGIRNAVQIAGGEIIGFADADNKVPIEELDKVMPLLERGYRVVIGSRALDRSLIERAQPLYRRLGSRVFAVSMRFATGLRTVSDTQCGFKFFQHDAAKKIFSHQKIDGYMFDVEILILAQHFGMTIHEVPIRWRDDGDSRLQLISGNLRNMRDILRIRLENRPSAKTPSTTARARVAGQDR